MAAGRAARTSPARSEIRRGTWRAPTSLASSPWSRFTCSLNLAYLWVLTPEAVAASPALAADMARTVAGDSGARFVSTLIVVSSLGFLAVVILTGPRLIYAMAADGRFFRAASRLHPRYRTPVFALWFQAAVSLALMATNTYDQLLSYVVFADWLFFGLTAGRLAARVWAVAVGVPGHPFTTGFFVAVAVGIVINSFIAYADAVADRLGDSLPRRRLAFFAQGKRRGASMKIPGARVHPWAKSLRPVAINLARSGLDPCPPSLLRLTRSDLVTNLPVKYGYQPLLEAIGGALRRGPRSRVHSVRRHQLRQLRRVRSGARRCACGSTMLSSSGRPTSRCCGFHRPSDTACGGSSGDSKMGIQSTSIAFAKAVTRQTRLAIVTNLHNPSGARIRRPALKQMARLLARVGALPARRRGLSRMSVSRRAASRACTLAPNVLTTNSLTKAYGLDGLRAGWILGPRQLIARAGRINDVMTNNGVAPGERMALAAFRRLRAIARARTRGWIGTWRIAPPVFRARTPPAGRAAGRRQRRVPAATARRG